MLIVERNTSVGNEPMYSASQTAFSTISDPLLESANLRKIQDICQIILNEVSKRYTLLIEPEDALHSQVTIYIAG